MTSTQEHARDEQLIAAILVILAHPSGLEVTLGGELWIERQKDGRLRVLQMHTTSNSELGASEEIFEADDVRSAIGYFLDIAEGRTGK